VFRLTGCVINRDRQSKPLWVFNRNDYGKNKEFQDVAI
jgi:hypothetical protein